MVLNKPILSRFENILKTRESHSARRKLTVAPIDSVDFSSNDFLSLSKAQDLRSAFVEEFSRCSSLPIASGGSRLLDGNHVYMEELERDIAAFHDAESGLLFNSGYDANSGLFACVMQPGDVLIYDEYIHASVHEGMRLSRASITRAFSHNSIEDFETVLENLVKEDDCIQRGSKNVFMAVETVYSMDGDVAPIKAILDIIDRLLPQRNGHLIVDEAHSTGLYGPNGRGIVCELGVEDRVFARLHTFGKALSSGGGISPFPSEFAVWM